MKLTACIITKEETDFLRMSIKQLLKFCDEIIITIDTRYKFDIPKYLINNKIQITYFNWIGPESYTTAMNYCMSHAKGDWILHLDADEIITDYYKLILDAINNKEEIDCFNLVSEHLIGNLTYRDATYTPHRHLFRLHKNLPEIRYPLDTMHGLPVGWKKSDTIGSITYPIIIHLGYCKNLLDIRKRYDENIKRLEMHSKEYLDWWKKTHMMGIYPVQTFNIGLLPEELRRWALE